MRLDDVYDRDEEQRALAALLFPRYVRMLQAVHQLVASLFPEWQDGAETPWRLDDPAVRAQLALAAERVVLIDTATRDALRQVLQDGQRAGYSTFELAHGVPKDGYTGIDGLYLDTWKGRSETIARNELAEAQHHASMDRYAATGMVTGLRLVENEDTDEPCASRNGRVVPLAERPQRLHVNCRLGVVPVLADES